MGTSRTPAMASRVPDGNIPAQISWMACRFLSSLALVVGRKETASKALTHRPGSSKVPHTHSSLFQAMDQSRRIFLGNTEESPLLIFMSAGTYHENSVMERRRIRTFSSWMVLISATFVASTRLNQRRLLLVKFPPNDGHIHLSQGGGPVVRYSTHDLSPSRLQLGRGWSTRIARTSRHIHSHPPSPLSSFSTVVCEELASLPHMHEITSACHHSEIDSPPERSHPPFQGPKARLSRWCIHIFPPPPRPNRLSSSISSSCSRIVP